MSHLRPPPSEALLPTALPFPLLQLEPGLLAQAQAFLDGWAREFGYTEETHTSVASTYLKYCSPPNATPTASCLAAEYLAWFLVLNDLPPSEQKADALRDSRALLQGQLHSSTRREAAVTQALLRSIGTHLPGPEAAAFRQRAARTIESFQWELALLLQSPQPTPPLPEYLNHRTHTIAHLPYLELWRSSLSVGLPDPRTRALLEEAELINTQVVFLVNDLLSISRDTRKGKPNVVFFIGKEPRCPTAEATSAALELLDQALCRYQQARDRLAATASDRPSLIAHVSFLDSVLEGNRFATVALHNRFLGSE